MSRIGKHPWHLLQFPKKTQAAVVVHCHFTLLVMALCTAFRLWQAQRTLAPTHQIEARPSLSTALLGGEGTARWRLRLKEENRDKVLIFLGDAYGIFYLAELMVLVRKRPPTSSLPPGQPPGHPPTLWHQPLILISKHQPFVSDT